MDQKYNSDSTNVKWSTIVLSVSLLLVYIVLFYVKGDDFKSFDLNRESLNADTGLILSEVDDNGNSSDLVVSHMSGILSNDSPSGNGSFAGLSDTDNSGGLLVVSEINLGQSNQNKITFNDGGQLVLPGTHTYYGDLDFVNLLGISYKYALTDSKGIYYLNMDGYTYDFSDIARKLGGNLYIMNTESEILANKMFGNKVTYINIPDYANKKVLMLIDVHNQSRLLAVDYSIYHQSKSYLKSLFIY